MRSLASSRRATPSALGIYILVVLLVYECLFDPEHGDTEDEYHAGTYQADSDFPGTGHALTRRQTRSLKGYHVSGHQLQEGSDDDNYADKPESSPRRSKSLADKYYNEWKHACHPIIASNRDYVSYHEGVHCWNHCHNALAIQNLDSWVGHAQAKLQANHFVRLLFPKLGPLPQSSSAVLISICYYCIAVICGLGIFIPPEVVALGVFVAFTWFVLIVLIVFSHMWFVLVLGTVVWAQTFATDAGLAEIFLDPKYSWAAPWAEAVTWLRNDYVPSNIIFYSILYAALALLVGFAYSTLPPAEEEAEEDARCKEAVKLSIQFHVHVFGFISIAVGLLVMAYQIFTSLISSGTHGVNWSCAKSFSAARAGWLPKDFPYLAGVVYTIAAVIHGLIHQPACVTPSCRPDARLKSFWCIPHTVDAIMMLMVKSGSILVDVLLDCAQSIMFFCRGQPFFGTVNITGIIIQMVTLLCQAARGLAQDCTLLAALLQSDLIANFRSSLEAGMVLLEFHEKAFREALGETFLSMSISISAFFTTHFRFTSDLHLMMLSLALSLNSIRSGIAESHEIVVAENTLELPGQSLCCQILPRNDYYARLAYVKSRCMSKIGMLRVCEAVVPVTTASVMMASSSAKTAYFTMTILSAVFFFAWYLRNNGMMLLHAFAEVFRSMIFMEGSEDEHLATRALRILVLSIAIIVIFLGVILWAAFWIATPFLTFQVCVFWSGSVAVPKSPPPPQEITEPAEDTWLYTFLDLASSSHFFSMLDDFSNAFAVKISYILALWSILLGCSYYHADLFDFQIVISRIIQARASAFSTQWWHGTIQLVLICFAVLCYLMMIYAVWSLRKLRATWLRQLTDAVQQQGNEFELFKKQLSEAFATLSQKHLCRNSWCADVEQVGYEEVIADAALVQLVGVKVLNQFFGPPDRRVFFPISINPAMLPVFLSGLEVSDDHWYWFAKDLPSFSSFPQSCVLCIGGDLVPSKFRDQNMLGQPLPKSIDARKMISLLSARFSNKGIGPIFLMLGCKASEISSTENACRESLKSQSRTRPSFKSLAEHTKLCADELALHLKSACFGRIVQPHLEKLENVHDCLMKIVHHCRETCLCHYFMEDGYQYTRLSTSEEEDESMSNELIRDQLLGSLADAVEAVPALDSILQEAQ